MLLSDMWLIVYILYSVHNYDLLSANESGTCTGILMNNKIMSDQSKTRKASDLDDEKELEGSNTLSAGASSSFQFTKQTKREPSMFLRLIESALLVYNSNTEGNFERDEILRRDLSELDEAIQCDIIAVDDFWGSIGYSLLKNAIKTDLVALVQMLLKYADQNTVLHLAKDKQLLLFACSNDHFEVVKLLLELGADPNLIGTTRDFEGRTCLSIACSNLNLNIVRLLLEKGAGPNLPDLNGVTPLLQATASDRIDTMKLLLAHGADTNMVFGIYDAPFIVACDCNNIKAIRLLLAYGADINAVAKNGDTPLIRAVHRHVPHRGLVQFLLERGADPSLADKHGKTALDYAEEGSEVAQLLINAQLEPILK